MGRDGALRQLAADATDGIGEREQFRLALMGGFGLLKHGVEVAVPLSAQRLLAFLALHRHPAPRAHVAGGLWPDSTQACSAASLRSALWRLRRPGLPWSLRPALTWAWRTDWWWMHTRSRPRSAG
ncbi:MAG: hypothetical protein ACRDZO_16045 [Egibacteraceae bacterium]